MYVLFHIYILPESSIHEPSSGYNQKVPMEWCGENKVSLSSYAYVRQKEVLTFYKILIGLKLKKY